MGKIKMRNLDVNPCSGASSIFSGSRPGRCHASTPQYIRISEILDPHDMEAKSTCNVRLTNISGRSTILCKAAAGEHGVRISAKVDLPPDFPSDIS